MRKLFLVAAIVLIASGALVAQNKKTMPKEAADNDVVRFDELEEKPTFQGGTADTFIQYVYGRLRYPEDAVKKKIEGRVVLQFIIDTDGSIQDIQVASATHPSLNKEAVRVVSTSPKWNPGKVGDKPVKVRYTLPVSFRLK